MPFGFLPEIRLTLKPGDIPDCFQLMDRILQKTEDVRRVEINPVLFQQVRADLPVIQSRFTHLKNRFREFALRAAAQRSMPAPAVEKIMDNIKHLFLERPVHTVVIGCRKDCFKKRSRKNKVGYSITDDILDFFC